MQELLSLRQENSKRYKLDGRKEQLVVSIGAIHYKDDYSSNEQWKDIDLTWDGNRITKAPYELTLEGNKVTIRDKKSGEVSTIELLEIGGVPIPAQAWERSKGLARAFDTDLEVVADYTRVKFVRILNSNQAPFEAKFKVTGKIPFLVRASDEDGEIPVESTIKDGILTETLKPDRPVKYPVRIDPTWQVGTGTDDCDKSSAPFLLYAVFLSAGWNSAGRALCGSGMRFTNITIPQGAIIDTAYLTLRAERSKSGTVVRTRISAENVDDAPTFADNEAAFIARFGNHTTARVDWDGMGAWTLNADWNSIEIKTVIKEIVDRGGWVSGQDIVIFWEDYDDRSDHNSEAVRFAYSYDGSTTYAPKLTVTYTEAPGWSGGDVLGVDIATIAKINGVSLADIIKVNGVA